MKNLHYLALIFSLIAFSPLTALAFDDCKLTLKKNESYMLFLDEKPVRMYVTQPKVISVQKSSDLFNIAHQIVIRTYSTGNSNIVITTDKNKQYTVNVKVEQNPVISNEVFEIDAPPES